MLELEDVQQDSSESLCDSGTNFVTDSSRPGEDVETNLCIEKSNAVWTNNSILALLQLYEHKLDMLETPKKKTRIWIAISDSLKDYNIEMSPDQVRWKINALTKKYKQCIDSSQHNKFKYFKQMDNIYSKYNVDSDAYIIAEILQHKKEVPKNHLLNIQEQFSFKPKQESRAVIELRKIRLANRIESDRSLSKIQLEKQWLQYLHRQEDQKLIRDEVLEKSLKAKEEELALRKRQLEMKESYELQNIKLEEIELEEMLKIERDKCDILTKIFAPKN